MAQTILVTGSTSGFGRLTVETLARQGHIVFAGMRAVTGRNASAAAELLALAQKEDLTIHIVEIDVIDDTSVELAIKSIVDTTGHIDVVVNNAGMSYSGPLEAFTLDQVKQQFDTNVFSVLRVNRAAIPHMRQQGSGLLIQIGSIAGRIALPFLGLYGSTKFALEGITESYSYELAPFGIEAAIIEPGTYPTSIAAKRQVAADSERFALYQSAIDDFTKPFYAENRSSTPPDPQEVANAVAKMIAQPAGERLLRLVVASTTQTQAPQEINEATTHATQSFFETLKLPPATFTAK